MSVRVATHGTRGPVYMAPSFFASTIHGGCVLCCCVDSAPLTLHQPALRETLGETVRAVCCQEVAQAGSHHVFGTKRDTCFR